MAHTITPVNTVSIEPSSGASRTVKITVENAVAPGPQPAASGVISVEFAGQTVTAPLEVEYQAVISGPPTATVDLGGATGIVATVGTAAGLGGGRYEIPITLTVA